MPIFVAGSCDEDDSEILLIVTEVFEIGNDASETPTMYRVEDVFEFRSCDNNVLGTPLIVVLVTIIFKGCSFDDDMRTPFVVRVANIFEISFGDDKRTSFVTVEMFESSCSDDDFGISLVVRVAAIFESKSCDDLLSLGKVVFETRS
jgi:hypothetical protein